MNKTISLLILASAALHVLVLGLIDFNSPTNIVVAGSLMRISIQAPNSKVTHTDSGHINNRITEILPTPKQTKSTKPKIVPVKKTRVTTKKELVTKPVETLKTVNKTTQTPAKSSKRTVAAKLVTPAPAANSLPESTTSLLHSDLERAFALHFYYPRIAIKRGWQGEVKISLRIESDGHLTRVRLLNSSGHRLLDKAAMESIGKVQLLSSAIALLDGQTMDLVLPVEYRLL